MSTLAAPCPRCGGPTQLTEANPWRPFCSQRCQRSDLSGWFAEQYGIPAEVEPDEPDATPEKREPLS